MSVFQDKKFIIHIASEIVIIGTVSYLFFNKTKKMEERIQTIEEELKKINVIIENKNSSNSVTIEKEFRDFISFKQSKNLEEKIKTIL